jgi:hypothetical protein
MANPEHLARLMEGVELWNQWRNQNAGVEPDLRDADLRRLDLSGVDLSRAGLVFANLHGATLSDADLREARLMHANLSEATLIRAKLEMAKFGMANLTKTDLSSAELPGADLSRAILVETNLEGADLTGCRVYGVSVWNVRLDGAKQSDLLITSFKEPDVLSVDNLEVAQFIYLLLNNAKIRDVIDTLGKKAVLILGRFTAERKAVLDGIREALRRERLLPILFDFEKPSTRNTKETIVTLAALSRFIIADITDPKCIPHELASIVPTFTSVPVQPLLQIGYEPWGMYDAIEAYSSVLPVVKYENQDVLIKDFQSKVIAPAEAKAKGLRPK